MKPKAELYGSQNPGPERMELLASDTLCSLHKYNLRSKGPPRYVRFSDDECPICLEDFNSPVIVNCGHSFCKRCIEKCMKIGKHAVCPICKDKLVKRLFLYNLQHFKHEITSNTEYRSSTPTVQKKQDTKHSNKPMKAARRTVA
ncbi:nuclear factor 7, ovary-like [Anopheles funestus]|uniref:RING-type domain-containing protein n=1 Tax=Anopheles funestus TaxID=62324 RepID=A0A182R813_ANOFN|nr:nuclear factor 7, ovary-like [Anopheles funestus]